MSFDTCTYLCNPNLYQDIHHTVYTILYCTLTVKSSFMFLSSHSAPCSSLPGKNFFPTVDQFCLIWKSCKWNHMVCTLYKASLTQCNVLIFISLGYISSLFLFIVYFLIVSIV